MATTMSARELMRNQRGNAPCRLCSTACGRGVCIGVLERSSFPGDIVTVSLACYPRHERESMDGRGVTGGVCSVRFDSEYRSVPAISVYFRRIFSSKKHFHPFTNQCILH